MYTRAFACVCADRRAALKNIFNATSLCIISEAALSEIVPQTG